MYFIGPQRGRCILLKSFTPFNSVTSFPILHKITGFSQRRVLKCFSLLSGAADLKRLRTTDVLSRK